jgi:hypothetical protein
VNDDKSPLIGLLNCIVCKETMKLENSAPTLKAKTSFSIVASGATELSEPPRDCRRLFGLSYAAMAGCSSMA